MQVLRGFLLLVTTSIKLILVLFILGGCSGLERPVLVEFNPQIEDSIRNDSSLDKYNKLQQLTSNDPDWKQAVEDVLQVLSAEAAEEQGQPEAASSLWLSILVRNDTIHGSRAFSEWVRINNKMAMGYGDPHSLAQKLIVQLGGDRQSLWLNKQGLTTAETISTRIQGLIQKGSSPVSKPLIALPEPRAFSKDPMLEKAADATCGRELSPTWKKWVSQLSPGKKQYWDGLQAYCKKDFTLAASKMMEALTNLEPGPNLTPYRLNASEKLIQSRKSLGLREETAAAYLIQKKILDSEDIDAGSLAWTEFELFRKKVEVALWVARTQALMGNYQDAKVAAQAALEEISESFDKIRNLRDSQRSTLEDLRLDAYHILSSRIAYEQHDFLGAVALNKFALQLSKPRSEWWNRLKWSEGWYAFMAGNRQLAKEAWEELLGAAPDEGQVSRLCYWLGRVYRDEGNHEISKRYFDRLVRDYPLSFYRVVALNYIDSNYSFSESQIAPNEMVENLREIRSISGEKFLADKQAVRKLLRAELCSLANLESWKKRTASELYEYVSKNPDLLRDKEPGLYVTRLLFLAAEYSKAMSLTNLIFKYNRNLWSTNPEQLLVIFPKPYRATYQRAAQSKGVDEDIPYAISRQESSFNPEARSPADAFGLMQLIRPTAERLARKELSVFSVSGTEIIRVDTNVALGVAYLADLGQYYSNDWPRAFAAYNAGEYAVDAWQKRRNSDDPLVWLEAITFGETASYVKNVWRNLEVYRFLRPIQ